METLSDRDAAGTLVLLLGGASYTGQPEHNLRLAEARAEWVKEAILRDILGDRTSHPTALDKAARITQNLHLVAIGLGERLPQGEASARAVEVRICSLTPDAMTVLAQN